MNLDEALGKITDPEVKAFFEQMVKNQNSYITKLENQLKEQKANGQPSAAPVDNITQAYIQKKMREEVIANASVKIIEAMGKEIFDAVKADFDEFLNNNLKPENTNESYVIDAFNLVLGRCYAKKDHPVRQVGKTTVPSGTPTPTPASGTNAQQIANVQNIVAGQPPVMTGSDVNAGQGIPGTQGEAVKNTKDAFSRLKERFANSGGSKFQ